MTEEAPPFPPGVMNFPAFRRPEHLDIYSNAQRIGVSASDLTIIFSRMGESGPAVEDLVTVRLSPYQFKTLAGVLTNALKAWEETLGEIPTILAAPTVESLRPAMEALKAHVAEGAPPPPKPIAGAPAAGKRPSKKT